MKNMLNRAEYFIKRLKGFMREKYFYVKLI